MTKTAATLVSATVLLASMGSEGVSAFVAPSLQHAGHLQRSMAGPAASARAIRSGSAQAGANKRRVAAGLKMSSPESDAAGTTATLTASEKALQQLEMAKALREEAERIEQGLKDAEQQDIVQGFEKFDLDGDGRVDRDELQLGMEKLLRDDFVKKLKTALRRSPTKEEVEERISRLPRGELLPKASLKKLLKEYDSNSDGTLTLDEFNKLPRMKSSLDKIFAEERQAQVAAMIEERKAARAAEDEANGRAPKKMSKIGGISTDMEVNNGEPTPGDRLFSILPYLLPLCDSVVFGGHLISSNPSLWAPVAVPLAIISGIYRAVPLGGLLAFFAISAASNNPSVNKLVRYNLRQSINLDIALFLPNLLLFIGGFAANQLKIDPAFASSVGEGLADFVFIATLISIAYSVGTSALGKFPTGLPLLGEMNRENPRYDEGDDE